ncbi:MAG: FadR/GntR family transcriptional regulator [Candidatus Korobacteraceae bacterium]|jgi:DNA-binding FadR family transcriptional regulator
MPINYQNINTEGVAKQIATNIRTAIMSGELKVDQRLPTEEELAERFGVSRPTIREALKRLAAQNLIHTRRGPAGGSFVKKPSMEDMRGQLSGMAAVLLTVGEFSLTDVVETRQELERACCHLAATRSSADPDGVQAQLREMEVELQKQRDLKITDAEFCASDVRFHCLIVDLTQNPLLRFLVSSVVEIMQPVLNLVVYRFRERSFIVDRHSEILATIGAGDPVGAVAAFDHMMEYLQQRYAVAQDRVGGNNHL